MGIRKGCDSMQSIWISERAFQKLKKEDYTGSETVVCSAYLGTRKETIVSGTERREW